MLGYIVTFYSYSCNRHYHKKTHTLSQASLSNTMVHPHEQQQSHTMPLEAPCLVMKAVGLRNELITGTQREQIEIDKREMVLTLHSAAVCVCV